MSTTQPRREQVQSGEINQAWWIVDAAGQTPGRLATKIATVLRGKHKPIFAPHVDVGDFVIVINAERVSFSGRKLDQKIYHHHTGYPGGLKSSTAREVLDRHPERVIREAVRGMLPKNKLARRQILKLKVYAGSDHPHAAQQPKPLA
jgi:large subunit ribosomal protein L13